MCFKGWKTFRTETLLSSSGLPANSVVREVLNMTLPIGDDTFYLVLDDQQNGCPDLAWLERVDVTVNPHDKGVCHPRA